MLCSTVKLESRLDFDRAPGLPGSSGYETVEARYSVFLKARLSVQDDEISVPMRVKNLSAGGLMAMLPYPFMLAENMPVSVHFPEGESICGRIAWLREESIGIAFDGLIDPLALLARRVQSAAAAAAAANALIKRFDFHGLTTSIA
jgi:PilZ domain